MREKRRNADFMTVSIRCNDTTGVTCSSGSTHCVDHCLALIVVWIYILCIIENNQQRISSSFILLLCLLVFVGDLQLNMWGNSSCEPGLLQLRKFENLLSNKNLVGVDKYINGTCGAYCMGHTSMLCACTVYTTQSNTRQEKRRQILDRLYSAFEDEKNIPKFNASVRFCEYRKKIALVIQAIMMTLLFNRKPHGESIF